MRVYETTFILNPQTDDATLDKQVETVANLITSNGGKILAENRMGTRRLAYPIRKLNQGYYTTLIYEAPPDFPPKLDRMFRLEEEFLRHLTILFEGDLKKILSKQEQEEPETKPKAESNEAPAEPETAPEKAESTEPEPQAEEPVKAEETEPPATEEPRVETAEETAPKEETPEPAIEEQYKPVDEDDVL